MGMLAAFDPIRLEVIKNRLTSLTEEMGAVLMRTAFSPNIKERRDFSCALFNGQGEMLAQAAHIPVHLGSMPLSVAAALQVAELQPGDMLLLNDPYRGGTHLPDLTLVMPVFSFGSRPDFFLANRAHHADVGGMTAGSLPLSREIFQEGLRIPPVRIVKDGAVDADLLQLFLANVRTPIEREGDLTAQIAANRVGERRLRELLEAFGLEQINDYGSRLLDYGEIMMRKVIADLPDGDYRFSDQLDDDGITQQPIRISVKLQIAGDNARVDLQESADQVPGCLNAVRAITLSAIYYSFRLLADEDIFYNAGCMRPIEVTTRPGSVVDASFPAAVAGGNVETSQRIVDVVLGALAEAAPERIPAASCGTMNNLTIGGYDPRHQQLFAYYETIAGGCGGGPQGPGASGLQTHMTNTLNTPVEALEHAYPLRIERYQLRSGSGGTGTNCGGEGIVKAIRLLADARVTLITDRRTTTPYGLKGGSPGKPGQNSRISAGRTEKLPGKCSIQAPAGDVIVIETPGGGGWGR
jgi:N-methylhydantoinase B